MRTHKRKKSTRYRGSQTARRGHRKRTKGSGNKGGVGMAGSGKRGDQKKTLVINLTGGNNYFGKDKTLRAGRKPVKLEVINLDEIIQKGLNTGKEINLVGYKILGDGDIKEKLTIKASAFSQSAKEKIEKAGGKVISLNEEKEEGVSGEQKVKKEVKK